MRFNKWFFLLPVLAVNCQLGNATEILFPASQVPTGKCSVVALYSAGSEDLNLHVSSVDQIKVGTSGLGYTTNSSNDLTVSQRSSASGLRVLFNPNDGLYYWLKAGLINYDVEVPSVSVKDTLSSQDNGYFVGVGARSLLMPDTIVTPAFSVEGGVTYSDVAMGSLKQGDTSPVAVNDKIKELEVQFAAIISKKIRKFEIYGGGKISRTYLTLINLSNPGSVSGYKDQPGAFFGARYYLQPRESLVLEASAFGDNLISIGWSLQF